MREARQSDVPSKQTVLVFAIYYWSPVVFSTYNDVGNMVGLHVVFWVFKYLPENSLGHRSQTFDVIVLIIICHISYKSSITHSF
jgi:hypothetical protein